MREHFCSKTATLKQMDPESDDIQSHNILSEYEHRPRALEHYCLAAFVSDLRIEYPKNVTFENPFNDNFDDDPLDPAEGNVLDREVLELSNGIVIKKNHNIKRDPENHYRERLMLFLPWRNEENDLRGGFKTYKNIIWPKYHSQCP